MVAMFVALGMMANAGGNTSHWCIGCRNRRIRDAPFVGGFARVLVTASFAYGLGDTLSGRGSRADCVLIPAVELRVSSLGIVAGETKNMPKNMPRVVKAVLWRRRVNPSEDHNVEHRARGCRSTFNGCGVTEEATIALY